MKIGKKGTDETGERSLPSNLSKWYIISVCKLSDNERICATSRQGRGENKHLRWVFFCCNFSKDFCFITGSIRGIIFLSHSPSGTLLGIHWGFSISRDEHQHFPPLDPQGLAILHHYCARFQSFQQGLWNKLSVIFWDKTNESQTEITYTSLLWFSIHECFFICNFQRQFKHSSWA